MARPVLMLLPGLLCDARVWRDQQAVLAERYDCRVPDWREQGSITAMAAQVLAEAPGGPFALAGHSMGGRVALEVLRMAPHRVLRLGLLDTGVDPRPPGDAGAAEEAGRMALVELARREGLRAMGRQWARGMVHPSRLGTPLFEEILDMIERRSQAAYEAQIRALLARPDARAVLAGARCPVLLLCGRQDQWSPLARHEQMHSLAPQSRLVVVEDSGHMTTMEQPRAVTAALLEWLEADHAR